ncbi:hypothetical protein FHG87_003610 [Trinorchestia longiramus]|nr:hypothetical protein FHG87_003610 [Trinorchestia longiramus]
MAESHFGVDESESNSAQNWVEFDHEDIEHTENVIAEDYGSKPSQSRRPIWTRESTHWLMEEMLQFESRDDKHQVKKRAVYEELAAKFSEANFYVSWEAVQKKWQNLMSTYWRNLKKIKKESQWEYFAEMDNILRNTSVWVGLNGCKDPKQSSSLHYKDQIDDRLWNNERIIFLLDEMRYLYEEGDVRGRRSIFHKISTSFQRIGVDLNWKLIQKKWHNLMTTYKRNLAKPRNEVAWELFDMIDNILNKPGGIGASALQNNDDVSHLSMSPSQHVVEEVSEDAVWTHDNTLWLMEEMKAVKERKDKHLLKNRVVFREIADAFNEENFMVDWKKVLRKWQTMYVIYSKIYQGLMQPMQWQYFERMHDIVGDTDMYVGVGNAASNNNDSSIIKTEREDCVMPSETVYHYINPEDNSQFIMTCSEALQNSFQVTCKPLDSRLTSENHEQFVELSPEFVTADYIGSGKSDSSAGDREMAVQFNAVGDNSKFTKLGTISVVNTSRPSLNSVVVKGKLPKRARYHLASNEQKSLSTSLTRNNLNGQSINEWKGTGLQENPEKVKNTFLLSSEGELVEQTVVLEDGVVFEEHLDSENGNRVTKAEYIEIEMAEVGVGDEECIEVQCDGAVSNSFDREVTSSNGEDDFEAVETAFEISEVPFPEGSNNLPDDFRDSGGIDSSVPVSSSQFWNC